MTDKPTPEQIAAVIDPSAHPVDVLKSFLTLCGTEQLLDPEVEENMRAICDEEVDAELEAMQHVQEIPQRD